MAIKLTEQDKRIIGYLFFHGAHSAAQTARVLGSNESTVRRAIQRLREQQVIYPVPFVNPSALGLTTYQVFLTVLTPGGQAMQQLSEYLRKSEQVVWVSALSADFHFDVMLLARHVSEVSSFLTTLSDFFPKLQLRPSVAGEVRFTYYPPRYLCEEDFGISFLQINSTVEHEGLSEQDHTILRALIDFPDLSQAQISKKISFPPSTLQYRIQQMEKKGLIQGFGYMVRPFAVGMAPFIYLLNAKSRSTLMHQNLHCFALTNSAVTFIVEQVGDWDYQVGARFRDAHESVAFLQQLHDALGDQLLQVRPIPVLESIKFEAYPLKGIEA